MGATVYWWHTFSCDVFRVNSPLTRIVSGLPVVVCRPNYDWKGYSSRPQDRSEWAIGNAFIAANTPRKIRWCFTLARWSLIPLLLLGGYFGFHLSREIYGEIAGLVFLILWCFSPLVLAWGSTICPDAVAASLGIVAVYTLRKWLRNPDWTLAAVAGVCLGLLPLAKLTWIIAFGLWPLIWLLWTLPSRWTKAGRLPLPNPSLRQLAVVFCLGLFTLNSGYMLEGTFRPLGEYTFISKLLHGQEIPKSKQLPLIGNRFSGSWLGEIPVPLPADFVQGIDTQRYDFERGLPSYLRGKWAGHGWWYYYLYALMIKVPLGTWCLVVLAIILTIFRQGYSACWRDEMLILLPFIVLLILISSQTGFSIHSRYILPALPFLFVWISKVGQAFTKGKLALCPRSTKVVRGLTVFFLGWMVLSSLWIYPHSLSYFNELAAVLPTPEDKNDPEQIVKKAEAGGSLLRAPFKILDAFFTAGPKNGPRHLLGSNIDWGQDLFYLEDWYKAHPEAQPFHVVYRGGYPLELSKIKSADYTPIGPDSEDADKNKNTDPMTIGPLPGYYALSVNEIYGRSKQYRYFLHFKPIAMAGYSIYIYHITLDEANLVRKKIGLSELPED